MGGASCTGASLQSAPQGRHPGRRSDARPGVVRAFDGLRILNPENPGVPEPSRPGTDAAGDGGRLLIVNLEGSGRFVTGGTAFELGVGDLLLVDARLPLRRDRSGGCREVRAYLPHEPVAEARASRRTVVPCLIDGGGGIGRLLRELICALLVAEGPFCPHEEAGVRAAVVALVAAAQCGRRDACRQPTRDPEPARGGRSEPPHQWRMLVECIDAHLSDPGLGPAVVAAMRGISTRHLHRLFRHAGVSFGSFVRARRLQRCRDDLTDPRFDGLPLTEIAYRWGFSDSSHFSRCFRSAFGCTAREFRARRPRLRPPPTPCAADALPHEGIGSPEFARTK